MSRAEENKTRKVKKTILKKIWNVGMEIAALNQQKTVAIVAKLHVYAFWPYSCETSHIWFFDRIIKTNK